MREIERRDAERIADLKASHERELSLREKFQTQPGQDPSIQVMTMLMPAINEIATALAEIGKVVIIKNVSGGDKSSPARKRGAAFDPSQITKEEG